MSAFETSRHLMSSIKYVLTSAVIFVFLAFAAEADDTVLSFAGDSDFPPYSFIDKDETYSGFSVDLARMISATMEQKMEISLTSPKEYTRQLINGEIDGIIGMPVLEELKKHISFSVPVKQLDCAIFVLHTNEYVRTLKSLEGAVVAMPLHSIYVDYVEQYHPKIRILETPEVTDAFKMLIDGEVTAVLCEKNLALFHIHENDLHGIKKVGPPIGPVYDFAIGVQKTNTKLLEDINNAINTLQEKEIMRQLKRKWFGVSLVPPFPWRRVATIIGTITGIMLFLMTGLWVVSLNAAVKIKTDHIRMLSLKMQEKDKLAVLGKLAGQIAHELRTPLSIISNSVFLMQREGFENPETYERRLKMLENKVRLTSNILESILSYSRVKAEVATTISVEKCLGEVLKDMEIPEGVSCDISIDKPEHLHVFMDFHQLYSVLRNILLNSLQAMTSGGTLSVHAFFVEEENSICVRVSDTGTGLSGITPDNIFDLFTSTKITGTGLGLPISKSIVETNGGSLYLESSSASGSVFVIKLPSSEKEKTSGGEKDS